MYYIIHIFYGLIFAASLLGYALLWKAKTKLPICFFPITAISGMTVCVYIFGLLGFLKTGCVVITIGGLLCLWFYRSWEYVKAIISDWSIWFCVFATIWLFLITRHSGLSHWDDFSHWYRICKAMNYEGAYPTTPDIRFYTYVPGTATWIYLFTRFIGFNVSNCFFAQGILHISCLACFFSAIERINIKWIKLFISFLVALMGVVFYSFDSCPYELLVDSLVGLVPLVALIYISYSQNIKPIILPLCLIFSFAAIIKNSCLLFIIFTFFIANKKFSFYKKEKIKYFGLWCVIPFILYRVYFIRASIFYSNAQEASQNMSLSRFYVLMQEKGIDNILIVIKNFVLRITDIGNDSGVTICYTWLLIFIFLYACVKTLKNLVSEEYKLYFDELAFRVKEVLIFGILIALVYCIGLLCTYVFAMSISEAERLASFFRYFSTITIYIIGGGVYFLLKELSVDLIENKMIFIFAVGMLLVFSLGFINIGRVGLFNIYGLNEERTSMSYTVDFWNAFQNSIVENKYYTEDSYLLLWSPEEYKGSANKNSRLRELAITWLRSANIQVISNEDISKGLDEKVLSGLGEYDYLVTLSDMSEQLKALKDYLVVEDYKVGICSISGGV